MGINLFYIIESRYRVVDYVVAIQEDSTVILTSAPTPADKRFTCLTTFEPKVHQLPVQLIPLNLFLLSEIKRCGPVF